MCTVQDAVHRFLHSRAAASPLGVAGQREDVLTLPVVLRHQHPGTANESELVWSSVKQGRPHWWNTWATFHWPRQWDRSAIKGKALHIGVFFVFFLDLEEFCCLFFSLSLCSALNCNCNFNNKPLLKLMMMIVINILLLFYDFASNIGKIASPLLH